MCRLSNSLIIIVNILALIISLPFLSLSISKEVHGPASNQTECQEIIKVPLLSFSVFIFILSLLGIIGSCCKVSSFLWIYIIVMFFVILAVFGFTIFVFVVTNKSAGKALSGKGYDDNRLGDYSKWLQQHVDGKNWDKIRTCFVEAKTCDHLSKMTNEQKQSDFYKKRLAPIQAGCCKPPSFCGFTYVNATVWDVPKSGPEAEDSDCTTWSNNQDVLCYNCKSCKGGVLGSLKRDWKQLTIFNIIILIFLIVIYTIAGCAFRNTRNDYYKRYRGYH
ncbi:hypothetical protein MKW98_002594 [Papaver atlanticum]|uniref:Senescence-associated protein n=1 Tax=Papaver atlanticum TaxID=357466 RepID=A0AAD4SBN5_9MAGN|nr:hypothetical protein MKW98_002594 [Papaver atlanticum]